MNKSLHNRIAKIEKQLRPKSGLWQLYFYDNLSDIPDNVVALPVKSDDYEPPKDYVRPRTAAAVSTNNQHDEGEGEHIEHTEAQNNDDKVYWSRKPTKQPEKKRGVYVSRFDMNNNKLSESKL